MGNGSSHCKKPGNKEQNKPNARRRKEIIQRRAEIEEIVNRKTIQKINETEHWCFEKVSEIDKSLARQTKEKREDTNY